MTILEVAASSRAQDLRITVFIFLHIAAILSGHEWHIYDVFVIYVPCDSLHATFMRLSFHIKQSFMQASKVWITQIRWKKQLLILIISYAS